MTAMTGTHERPPAGSDTRFRALCLFLGAVFVTQFGYPISLRGPLWSAFYMLGYAAVILFGISVVDEVGRDRRPFFGLAALVIIGGTWFSFQQHETPARTAMLLSIGLFQTALLWLLFRGLLHDDRRSPTRELLVVALCCYLLLGGVFGVAFNLLETFAPGSFVDNAASDSPLVWQGLMYTSYVTLTTLGFGDVLAVTSWARSLVTLEAVLGTLFIAVVISRLVGSRD